MCGIEHFKMWDTYPCRVQWWTGVPLLLSCWDSISIVGGVLICPNQLTIASFDNQTHSQNPFTKPLCWIKFEYPNIPLDNLLCISKRDYQGVCHSPYCLHIMGPLWNPYIYVQTYYKRPHGIPIHNQTVLWCNTCTYIHTQCRVAIVDWLEEWNT